MTTDKVEPTTKPKLVSAAVAARDWFGVSRRTVGRWIAQGRLQPYKTTATHAGRVYFRESDLMQFVESMRATGSQD